MPRPRQHERRGYGGRAVVAETRGGPSGESDRRILLDQRCTVARLLAPGLRAEPRRSRGIALCSGAGHVRQRVHEYDHEYEHASGVSTRFSFCASTS